ncbi:mesogenin-1-like [Discoglossus pictus]
MDVYSASANEQDCIQHPDCVTLYQCGYPSSEGYISLSPASSSDSCELSPPYMPCTMPQRSYGNIPATHLAEMGKEPTFPAEHHKKKKGKLAYSQRQTASEREKMRMRNLSKALQNLRRYLPPSVGPADKNLTKIETLQLAIRYISHLSDQLGLSEDVLAQRRQATIQRNSFPLGLSCYMERTHKLCSETQEEYFKSTAPAGAFPETRPFSVGSGFDNIEAVYKQPYEVPYTSDLERDCLQEFYPVTSSAQPQCQYTGLQQQQIITEGYTDLLHYWRREQSQA